jgi:hypothetical protein
MEQRIKITAFLGILLIVSLFFMSCGDTKTTSLTETGGTGGLGVTLKWKDILGKRAAKSAVKSAVPLDVATVRVSISGPDMITITKDFSASSGGGIINAVPAGTDRKVSALGLDSTGYVLYSGNVSGITITGGTTTTVEITLLPTGVTAAECLNAVNQDNVIEARDICVAAANSYESIVSNDADTARFFAALSRVAALWYNQTSDGNPNNGLLTAGDILDAFGCSVFGRDPEKPDFTCPSILPSNSPTGGELKTFINNVMRPEIAGAIDNLNYVSQSFNINWIEPIDGTTVESDFGDVLAARALFKSLLASIIIENSYNLDADFDLKHPYTFGAFLADNPNFLKLSNASELSSAQNYLIGASDDTLSAIDWIQAETDDQNDDFINLLDIEPAEINEAKEHINEGKAALTGPSTLYDDDEKTQMIGTLNLTNFFIGMDLRNFLPTYTGDIPGFFPDPTFNGIWTNYTPGAKHGDPNRDLDNDGIPDILESSDF